jgi:hypothetical protein
MRERRGEKEKKKKPHFSPIGPSPLTPATPPERESGFLVTGKDLTCHLNCAKAITH